VRGLETTATYDKETDEFVINTPTITATKYWPGDLAQFSTHTIVFARCITNGKDHGVQPFLCQVRDLENYMPMKGIKLGNIGPKVGYLARDNSFATFDHVRIPRSNLLSRFCEVSKDGTFKKKGDQRVLYAMMMSIRNWIIKAAGY